MEAWAYPDTAQVFLGTPYYLTNGKRYGFQIWPVHSWGSSEQKPIKNFWEKERGCLCDNCMGFLVLHC